jgi:hypothetical protein
MPRLSKTGRLEYLRGQLRAESISYAELAELESLAEYIAPGDVELLEPAGVPEHADTEPPPTGCGIHTHLANPFCRTCTDAHEAGTAAPGTWLLDRLADKPDHQSGSKP